MAWASTGLSGLDKLLSDLRKGDNVVWQVDSVDDYRHFLEPYVARALQDNRNIVYMRFAEHRPLIDNQPKVKVYQFDAEGRFEGFSKGIHNIISKEGRETYYEYLWKNPRIR